MQQELACLLNSGSERCGALDFQRLPTEYVPRIAGSFSLEELLSACSNVEQGRPLPLRYQQALCTLSTIGGERPKVLAVHDYKPCIAKFPALGDPFNLVKAEYIAMRLAALVGLQVAPVQLLTIADRAVLLVERFDRSESTAGWLRHHYVNALTLLELSNQQAPWGSYADLAELIRFRFASAKTTLHELFGRLVFNVLCGNTDDGAHNHAAFWDGHNLALTPAFDICPQPRHNAATVQAMLIVDHDRRSRLATCLHAARHFLLSDAEALTLMEQQLHTIIRHWRSVCDEAALDESERAQLWGRVFVAPAIFEDLTGPASTLALLLAPAAKPRKAEQLSLL